MRSFARISSILSVTAALVLSVMGVEAQAGSEFDHAELTDVRMSRSDATRGTDLDTNVAQFDIDDDYDASFSRYSPSSRYHYQQRQIDGTFSNSNDDSTKRAVIQWMVNEPDSVRRTSRLATVSQKKYVQIRVILYTSSGSSYVYRGEVEDCGVNARARDTDEDDRAEDVRITLRCKRDYLVDGLGMDEDMADMVEDAIGRRTLTFNWRERDTEVDDK